MPPKLSKAATLRRSLLASFGARVHRARASKGLTQAALARELGLSVAYVSLIERGGRNPPYRLVVTLARALGVPAGVLVE